MTTCLRFVCFAFIAVLPAAAVADPLELRVGTEAAQAMGLHKLTAEERLTLARWIERHLDGKPVPMSSPTVAFALDGVTVQAQIVPAMAAAAVAAPAASGAASAFGLEQTEVEGELAALPARIVGEFVGWDGKTLFKLDNGQVWRQSTSGVYRHKSTDPEITIERGAFGYKLRVVETKRSIAVRRIK